MTYDTDPLLASAGRGILFSLKLSIMHKNGPAVYTKCSHGLFRAARYNYTTQRKPRQNCFYCHPRASYTFAD